MGSGTDDYELALAIAVAAGADDAYLVDPITVERLGSAIRPAVTDLVTAASRVLSAWSALPPHLRAAVASAAT